MCLDALDENQDATLVIKKFGRKTTGRIIEFTHGKHIPHKSKRRKPWIRYERKHSLSMVHLDWHTSNHDGKKVNVCVVLDDSSRILINS